MVVQKVYVDHFLTQRTIQYYKNKMKKGSWKPHPNDQRTIQYYKNKMRKGSWKLHPNDHMSVHM
jgi:hypothetical protein